MGGAAAAQVVAEDHRFLVGVNLDGTLPQALAGGWHLGAPFLWLQSDGQQQASYLQGRDRLLAGVPGSEVLVAGGTSHTSFTDLSAYVSPLGRGLSLRFNPAGRVNTIPGRGPVLAGRVWHD